MNIALIRRALVGEASRPTPAVDLDFIAGRYAIAGQGEVPLEQALLLTRESRALYRNSAGLYVFAEAGEPRLDHDATGAPIGLLYEPGALSLGDATSLVATATTITPGQVAPDGSETAFRLEPTSADAAHFVDVPITFASGAPYSARFAAKAAGYRYLRAVLANPPFPTNPPATTFDLQDGVITAFVAGAYAAMRPLGDGWHECLFGGRTSSATASVGRLRLNNHPTNNQTVFVGDGGAFLIWQYQWERGPYSTSFQPVAEGARDDETALLLVDNGHYDVLVEGARAGVVSAWTLDMTAADEQGLLLPTPPPDGMTHIHRVRAWLRGKTSVGFRAERAPEALPVPRCALVAGQGMTLDGDGRVSAWASVDGAPGSATASAGARAIPVTVSGATMLSVAAGNSMSLSGWTRARDDLTVAIVYQTEVTSRMTVLGVENAESGLVLAVNRSPARDVVAGVPNHLVSLSPPVAASGAVSIVIYTRRGTFQAWDIDGVMDVQPTDTGCASMLDTVKRLWRRASGSEEFSGLFGEYREYTGLLPAERAALMRELVARWGGVEIRKILRPWSGATTTDGFTAAADATSAGARVRLRVSTEADGSVDTFTGEWITPSVTPGLAGKIYYPVKASCTGLTAGTAYHWLFEIEGEAVNWADASLVKTAPALGQPFVIAFGSCNLFSIPATSLGTLARVVQPDLMLHLGDAYYGDPDKADVGLARSLGARAFRDDAFAAQLCAAMAVEYIYDDHDAGPNDVTRGDVYGGGVTGDAIMGVVRQAFRETVPHHPLADAGGRSLARAFSFGPLRIILMDTMSGRMKPSAETRGSVLGDPARWPGDWDQMAWLKAELLAAAGHQYVLLASPSGVGFHGVGSINTQGMGGEELTEILDFVRDNPSVPQLVTLVGDYHRCCLDDGGRMDQSSPAGGGVSVPLAVSSALSVGSANSLEQIPGSWAGEDYTPVARQRQFMTIHSDGGAGLTIKHWYKDQGEADETVRYEVHFDATEPAITVADVEAKPGATVRLSKSFFGPAQVDWSWEDGPSGTAVWGPNQRHVAVPAPGAEALATLTLSDAVGCDIPTPSVAVNLARWCGRATDLFDVMTNNPSEDERDIYDALIRRGLRHGWLERLDALWLLAGRGQEDSLLNLPNPAEYGLERIGALTHQPGLGWIPGASVTSRMIAADYVPAAGGTLLTAREGAFGIIVATPPVRTGAYCGLISHHLAASADPPRVSGRYSRALRTVSGAASTGHFYCARDWRASFAVYRDGAAIGLFPDATQGAITEEAPWMLFRRDGQQNTGARHSAAWAGGPMRAVMMADLDAALRAAVAALGELA
jgi:hypothetical protein